ncbi:MAG TPA: glycosyltransferase family 2 protein [Methylomusa anaerophila]|uniref:Glycosyltransferase 2-like domain-containing protein n=1 Tax=Methylomusa anaerophila TaxID=1930071 RepID=A0A348AKM5_9FIRM|nr:glycosyltransferase family 2 protein [Methylomusa anaerophila]BBB91623.1 hypothetical protein MAMMFC1_02307 [Methylomusa anaerophila]HML89439.1 glycosyltransferase family 2 protein [Methylomusa anaerophila]
MSKKISVLVPMYNEMNSIEPFFERLLSSLGKINYDYEVICVNDGSTDNTLEMLIDYSKKNNKIKIINFSRNFGKEIAMTAALDYSAGHAVVLLDADLQHPPEVISELINEWNQGYDVVYATRKVRLGESWLKKTTALLFYRIIKKLSDINIPQNTGDFRLMDRRVVEALKKLPERTRFMKGLFAWIGFKQKSILFEQQPRWAGQTTWNYWKLWNFALEGITSFSSFPLKVWGYVGVALSIISFVYVLILILQYLIRGVDVPGYTSIMVVMLFLGGIQLIGLGVIGEYLGRVFIEVKERPLYIIRDLYGFDHNQES